MFYYEGQDLPKPLSNEYLNYYFCDIRDNNNKEARNKIILHNLRLVIHICNRYKNNIIKSSFIDEDDLLLVGAIGLVKAVDSFDIDLNIKFATYATKCINNEILMQLRKLKNNYTTVSIYDVVSSPNSKFEDDTTIIDLLRADNFSIDEAIISDENKKEIRKVLHFLNDRDSKIIREYYGIGCKRLTQGQIAEKYNLSQSYVSRICTRIREKLYGILNYNDKYYPSDTLKVNSLLKKHY